MSTPDAPRPPASGPPQPGLPPVEPVTPAGGAGPLPLDPPPLDPPPLDPPTLDPTSSGPASPDQVASGAGPSDQMLSGGVPVQVGPAEAPWPAQAAPGRAGGPDAAARPEPAEPPATSSGSTVVLAGTPARRPVALVVGLVLMLLAAAAAAGMLVHDRRVRGDQQAVKAASTQALATMKLAAPLLLSYDYRTLTKDFATAVAYTGGEFKNQYQQTTTTVVAPVALQYKAVVRAQLIEVGVSAASRDTVTVVAFINQVTTSTRVTGTKLDQSRVRMQLQRTVDGWKVVAVKAL